MKIQSTVTRQIYNYEPPRDDRSTCPECSGNRRNKAEKCLTWDKKNNRGFCHHCEAAFFEYKPQTEKQYYVPEWTNKTDLTDMAVKYFEGRMISQDVLVKMKVFSDEEYMPQFKEKVPVICFPYFRNKHLINIKYRGPEKSFKLVPGAELIFWNYDCLENAKEVVIVEGEIDGLTMIQAGFENTISVPNGANKNLEYLDSCSLVFNDIQRIYIAVDQDTKGIELKNELIRRLGAEKCFIVSFKDCKDANDYLQKYGPEIKDVLQNAIPAPVKGIINIDSLYSDIRSLYEEGIKGGLIIDDKPIDDYITWETGRLMIVGGIPSSGKSEFVDYLVTKLNIKYGWKAGYFTPENYPLKFHYMKLFEKIIGKHFDSKSCSELEWDMAYEYIKDNFFYILDEEDFTVNTIIESARFLVKNKGIKVVIIDPYNKLEHQYKDSETQYISRFLDILTRFAKINDILMILVAHPRKMNKTNGKFDVPTLYDISGSAHFYNKSDYGITIHRRISTEGTMTNEVDIFIQKIKFKHLGIQGIINLKYDFLTGRFFNQVEDRTNWLVKEAVPATIDFIPAIAPPPQSIKLNPDYREKEKEEDFDWKKKDEDQLPF